MLTRLVCPVVAGSNQPTSDSQSVSEAREYSVANKVPLDTRLFLATHLPLSVFPFALPAMRAGKKTKKKIE